MGFIEDIESYTIKNIIQTYIFYVIVKNIVMKCCFKTYEIKHNLIIENEYYNYIMNINEMFTFYTILMTHNIYK